MRLIEHTSYLLIEDFFPSGVVVGFTKPNLEGILPQDSHKVFSSLKLEPQVSYMNQLHSAIVHCIDKPGAYNADALFTTTKNQALIVKTADCLPIFLAKSDSKIIGILHMGWRSAKEGILDNIPYELDSFKVGLGVGLRQCCFEVGDEFLEYRAFKPFLKEREDKVYFDPVNFAKSTLIEKGLKERNLFDMGICSFCSDKGFFSYRRSKTSSRTLSFILNI